MKWLLAVMMIGLVGCERSTLEDPLPNTPPPVLAPTRTLKTPAEYYNVKVVEDTVRGVTCYYIGYDGGFSCLKTFDGTNEATKVER